MSTDARPTTDPTVPANGAVPPAPDEIDPRPDLPRWEPGPGKLPLSVSWRERIRDLRWIDYQRNSGGLDQYAGNYIAVWEERVIAFDPNLRQLRERVKQLLGDLYGRHSMVYIPAAIDEGAERVWPE